MARIALVSVIKEFSGRRGAKIRALDQLSLEIQAGERLAILGPSGSGKTTLLRIIAGLENPSEGSVWIDQRNGAELPPQDREMAMVFQRDALLPHLTARENIALGLKLRGHTREEVDTRVREAIECFRLRNVLDRLPRALSGGERQRTALARAIVRRPRALLLDEPLSSVDPPLRAELRRDILEFHRRLGCTVVLVTHDQGEALAMGDRVGVLNNGTLQQIAEPAALYDQPATAFVAGFVGSPPMNLFRGSLALEGGSLWFHGTEGSTLSLCLTDTHRKSLASALKNQIIVGLRAENIFDAIEGASLPYGSEAEALVEVVEYLGADALVQWTCGSTRFTTRSHSSRIPQRSTRGRLVFDMSQACFFDATTGSRLKA